MATNGAHQDANGAHVAKATRKARTRLPSESRSQVIPDLAMWNQAARIGGGITPSKISTIIRTADTGDIRQLMDLANECRQRDAHLQAVLSTSEESIAGLPWQIVAPLQKGGKPRSKDRRAAEWVAETLRGNPGMQRLIADLAGAVYYSFAVDEIVWKKDSGRLVPDAFLGIAPRRFRFRRTDGKLVQYDEGSPELDFLKEYPNKFIVSRPRVTGDVPSREGLCRVLIWMSVMRNWDIGDWLKCGELSWKPWRVGTYKKQGASREDREDLETVMRRMTTDFTAVIPDSATIKVDWPGGSATRGGTHAELCNVLAQEISKAVLGQTETVQASTSSGYAQAKVHDAVRRDLREARARQVAADITRDLIGPMIRLNFGDSVEVPRFEFVTQDPVDLKAFSESLKNLREAGARIPEAWALEQAGIPEPKKDERVLGEASETDEGKPPADGTGANAEEEDSAAEGAEEPDTDE